MSRTNDVHSSIWTTDEFLDLSPPAKLLYFWSFTNSEVPMSGIYKVSLRVIAFATGMNLESVQRSLDELAAARFIVYSDGLLFVRARVKRLRTRTDQIATSIVRDVHALPVDHPVRIAFVLEYGDDFEWGEGRLVERLLNVGEVQRPSPTLAESQRASATLSGKGKGKGKKNHEDGRASEPKPVTYRNRRVPPTTVEAAEHLCTIFAEATERACPARTRTGDPTPALKQIAGALLLRDEVPVDIWAAAIRGTVAKPPGWADGRALVIGDIFGEKAAEHALALSNGPAPGGEGNAQMEAFRNHQERLAEARAARGED